MGKISAERGVCVCVLCVLLLLILKECTRSKLSRTAFPKVYWASTLLILNQSCLFRNVKVGNHKKLAQTLFAFLRSWRIPVPRTASKNFLILTSVQHSLGSNPLLSRNVRCSVWGFIPCAIVDLPNLLS